MEVGIKYELVCDTPAQRVVFNDPTDADFVGYLVAETSLGGPSVREFADDLVEGDGAYVGRPYYGKGTVSLSGFLMPLATATLDRAAREKLVAICHRAKVSADVKLRWAPSGASESRYLPVRLAQAWRISDLRPKRFLLQFTTPSPFALSNTLRSVTAVVAAGATASPNLATVGSGVGNAPFDIITIINNTSGLLSTGTFRLTNGDFASGYGFALTYGQVGANGVVITINGEKRTVTRLLTGTTTNQYAQLTERKWGKIDPVRGSVVNVQNNSDQPFTYQIDFRAAWLVE